MIINARQLTQRRIIFFSIILLLTSVATWIMADILWRGGVTTLKFTVLCLFVPLFALVALGFTQALAGFWMLRRGGDPCRITQTLKEDDNAPLPVTAIALPIYNEDVSQVYEGLRVMFRSLEALGQADRFDFFILSDSNDPNKWIEEEVSWVELCKQLKGFGRIFYRHRQMPLHRKSGNISDFCRRWGARYRYMVIRVARPVDGGKPARRHHPVGAAVDPQRDALRTDPPICQHALRPRVHGGPELLAVQRRQLLGPQRHHPHRPVHRTLRPARHPRPAARHVEIHEPRLRRGGADVA
jgi:hypothetical protein